MLTLKKSCRIDDKSGRVILTYTPTLTPINMARGGLTFAIREVWADEPETYAAAQEMALQSAREVLRQFATL